ncbi:hypothetical protein MACJ_003976 [Theileria orientalis]|uniref:N-acetyltransferase domain-containing protein n=1 Tax=Theileria orientalis TaxID=68886 RepID=A0A976SKQ0_THEOR|nr:hypothetical protein MACJ_003976 [Theileria orientalis]
MNKIKNYMDIKKGRMPSIKPIPHSHNGRRSKCPSILIREIELPDNVHVCKLLFDHFRSLTLPAIIYWLVQHIYDLLAIVLINACLLSLSNLFYFCLLFLIYLFVRARYEIEKHIKESCPDLVDVYKTYRNHKGSNFWVAYVSGDHGPDSHSRTETNKDSGDKNKTGLNPDPGDKSPESDIPNGSKRTVEGNEVNEDNFSESCQAYEILGCVGITQYRNVSTVAQMVRLVVTRKRRNMKVGTRLLEHLEKKALEMGYTEIRVFTNNLNTAYLQFLKMHNFQIIQIIRRGLMRGDLIVWTKHLKATETVKDAQDAAFGNAMFIPE